MQSSLARFTVSLSTLFILACASLPAHADTAAKPASNAPIPVGDFFNNRAFSGAVMSPDGRHLAVLVSARGGRVQLYTVELAGMKVSGLTSFEDADIARIAWVNDQRIVYSVADRNSPRVTYATAPACMRSISMAAASASWPAIPHRTGPPPVRISRAPPWTGTRACSPPAAWPAPTMYS